MTVGSSVAKWSQADRRHLPGWIISSIDDTEITIHRPDRPGHLTVNASDLIPAPLLNHP